MFRFSLFVSKKGFVNIVGGLDGWMNAWVDRWEGNEGLKVRF